MKKINFFLFAALCLACTSFATAQSIVLETTTPFERVDIGKTPTAPAVVVTPPTGTIWAVIVGIEDYEYSEASCISDLSYAKNDAYEFANYLQYNLGIPPNQIAKLLDNKASEANILKSLETQFSQAGSNDMVLFYFSGHGEDRKFIPNDYKCRDDGTGLPTIKFKGIETAFDKSKAKHKLLIADACRVEKTNAKSPALLRQQQAQFYDELNKAQAGVAILMSASKGELSKEAGGNGLFTYHLLQGLNGAADSNKNGIVTVSEIAKYVKSEVVRASDDEQHPEINTGGYDPNMPVGVVGQ